MARVVVADTNMLLVPSQDNINLDAEFERLFKDYRLVMLESVKKELEALAQGNGRAARAAKFALQWCTDVVPSTHDHADDDIVAFAAANDCVVVTQDKGLRKRLQDRDITVAVLRNKNHVELI